MDRGYTRTDAEWQADLVFAQYGDPLLAARNTNNVAVRKKYWANIVKSYQLGTLGQANARVMLASEGWATATVNTALANADLETHYVLVRETLKRARGDYMSGRKSEQEVKGMLVAAELQAGMADYYMTLWKLQRGQKVVQLSAAKVLRFLRLGLITVQEAASRLTNLGYNNADQLLLLAETEVGITKDAAAVEAASERTGRAKTAALEKAAKDAAATLKAAQTQLRAAASAATLVKWAAEGRISFDRLRERLSLSGYDKEAVENYVLDAMLKQEESLNGKTKE